MASVWMEKKGVPRPRKIRGHMSLEEAMHKMERMMQEWRREGGMTKRLSGLDALLFHPNGNLAGSLYVEPMSPPSAPEPGQPRRAAAT